ncbi:restriction endonuclease subunit S [Vibrio alginolyticus]|uniref:restriction endonuclease subunit S n=1 Tax=Vibrio alginolyticus TaxID=663 RepID=UPI001BD545AA|nr:restriction endonuclease subunit S [Vibrio alginolyticus]MBS9936760.1 restriction endonuclease subunit S [Vibrio alginolyticus]
MRSNYKKLGQFIKEVSVKNKDLSVELLLGVSITKQFIPSIANTVGTDMSKYKVVEHHQFAYGPVTSRNGEKISVALLSEEKCIVSTSYTVFEIVDTELLDPEYLMMWFRRSEFDRYARYMSHGTVRELFGWQEMCDVELPVPSIEKQREIVREYNVVNDRIALNEQLTQKLEDTAQAIYKQWFVDFEFPISKEYAESIGKPELEGKPYKSSGGDMEYCGELEQDIPRNWSNGCFGDVATQFSGYSFKGEQYDFFEGTTVIRGENVTEGKLRFDTHKRWNLSLPGRAKDCFLENKDIVIGMDGSKVGKNWSLISPYQLPLLLAQRVCCVRAKSIEHQLWLYVSIKVRKFADYVSQVHTGTSVPHISGDQIMAFSVLIPENLELINQYDSYAKKMYDQLFVKQEETLKLAELRKIILQKMS